MFAKFPPVRVLQEAAAIGVAARAKPIEERSSEAGAAFWKRAARRTSTIQTASRATNALSPSRRSSALERLSMSKSGHLSLPVIQVPTSAPAEAPEPSPLPRGDGLSASDSTHFIDDFGDAPASDEALLEGLALGRAPALPIEATAPAVEPTNLPAPNNILQGISDQIRGMLSGSREEAEQPVVERAADAPASSMTTDEHDESSALNA